MTTKKTKTTDNQSIQLESETNVEPKIKTDTSKKSATDKATKAIQIDDIVPVEVDQPKASTKKTKQSKVKVIRDTFSFPEQDYRKISELKKNCLAEGIHVKKSEVLRAGLHLLAKLSIVELIQAVEQVEKLKTGRPNADKSH